MRPLGNRVCIEPDAKEKTTLSGIIIPDSVEGAPKPKSGKIIAIGTNVEEDLKVGDTVLFGKYAGYEWSFKGRDVAIVSVDELLIIID